LILRNAEADDFAALLPYAQIAHSQSLISSLPMDENALRRSFITSIAFDDGFAKVVERDGRVVGGMVGVIADNHFGIRCAMDLFTYTEAGTQVLLKSFKRWAQDRGALMLQITDLSGGSRYQKLIQHIGPVQAGINFIEVF